MSNRPAVKSAFDNLRPTIIREPKRSTVSDAAEEKLLTVTPETTTGSTSPAIEASPGIPQKSRVQIDLENLPGQPLLLKKKRERHLLVSFRCPEGLKEKLELAAKKHEISQTDIINEAIAMNLQRYL
jgi:hypothetical protein